MALTDMELWEKSAEFHGHICPGLTIGYKAALYACKLLELTRAEDEEVVCVTENDACGVDAISVILGCSVGKGNLLFKLRGKQALSLSSRKGPVLANKNPPVFVIRKSAYGWQACSSHR